MMKNPTANILIMVIASVIIGASMSDRGRQIIGVFLEKTTATKPEEKTDQHSAGFSYTPPKIPGIPKTGQNEPTQNPGTTQPMSGRTPGAYAGEKGAGII